MSNKRFAFLALVAALSFVGAANAQSLSLIHI